MVVVFRVPAWRLSIDFLPVFLPQVIYSYNLIGVQELWGTISTETCVMYYCHLHTQFHNDLVSAIYTADVAPLVTEKVLRKAIKKSYEIIQINTELNLYSSSVLLYVYKKTYKEYCRVRS